MSYDTEPIHLIRIGYICRSDGSGEVKLGEDHSDYKWVTPAEIGDLKLSHFLIEILKDEASRTDIRVASC